MKICNNCKIKYVGQANECPLCSQPFVQTDESPTPTPNYHLVDEQFNAKRLKRSVLLLLITVGIIFVAFLAFCVANLIGNFYDWFVIHSWLIFCFGVCVYVICLVWHTILSRRNVFEKLLFQLALILACGYLYQWISSDYSAVVNYVIPYAGLLASIIMFVLLQIFENRYSYQVSALLVFIAFFTLSIVFLCLGLYYSLLPILSLLIFCVGAIISQSIMYHKNLKYAFTIAFHL